MVYELFNAIDSKDAKAFVNYLAPSCEFRFGNMPAVKGLTDIEAAVNGFFESLGSLSHQLTDVWETAEAKICHGQVSYTRKDGSVLTIPFANVLKGNEQGITEYLIFADTSTLYEY